MAQLPNSVKDLGVSQRRDEVQAFIGTSTGKLPNHGVVTIFATSGTKTFTIEPPVPGCRVAIISVDSTTDILTVSTGSTGIAFNVAGAQTLTFNSANEAVELVGLSTTRYGIVSNVGSVGVASLST